MQWFLDRLGEASTWRGLIALATAAGIAIDPTQAAAITAAGIALIGVINVFRKEQK